MCDLGPPQTTGCQMCITRTQVRTSLPFLNVQQDQIQTRIGQTSRQVLVEPQTVAGHADPQTALARRLQDMIAWCRG